MGDELTTYQVGDDALVLVSAGSSAGAVGGAIVKLLQEGRSTVRARSIGASAVNQAVKGVAVATLIWERDCPGVSLLSRASFETVTIAGQERTSVVLQVRPSSG